MQTLPSFNQGSYWLAFTFRNQDPKMRDITITCRDFTIHSNPSISNTFQHNSSWRLPSWQQQLRWTAHEMKKASITVILHYIRLSIWRWLSVREISRAIHTSNLFFLSRSAPFSSHQSWCRPALLTRSSKTTVNLKRTTIISQSRPIRMTRQGIRISSPGSWPATPSVKS